MVALFRLPSVSTQMLSLSGRTTLQLLRFAHLLVACDREEQGNCTVERSRTAAPSSFVDKLLASCRTYLFTSPRRAGTSAERISGNG